MRRMVLVTVFAVAAVWFSATALAQPKLAGIDLTLLIHPTLYAASGGDGGIITEFEKATGARVQVVTAPIPEYAQRAMLEFTAGTGRYDVIAMQSADFTSGFDKYFLPLDDYIKRDGASWDWGDVIPELAATANQGGKQLGIPYRWNSSVLYYRTDLLKKAGLQPPTTPDEVLAAAKVLTKDTNGDGKTDIYGFVQRGKAPDELSQDWLRAFFANGGDFFTKDGKCGLASPAGIAAAQLWADLFKIGSFPPDVFAWGRDDQIEAMRQGRVAMGVYVDSYYQKFFGPDSKVKRDQIGWAPVPTAKGVPTGRSLGGGWVLVINKNSRNPDAAWELIKTLTSADNQLRMAVQYANGPIRSSVYKNPKFAQLWPQASVMLNANAHQAKYPAHPAVARILEIISDQLTEIMRGKRTPEAGMARVCELVNADLAKY